MDPHDCARHDAATAAEPKNQIFVMLSPNASDFVTLPPDAPPMLLVSVDTEEDFDWDRPLTRGPARVDSIARLGDIHQLFASRGIKPCYLVDYPIATDPLSLDVLRPWIAADACVIGSQLHPWVNPPYAEELHEVNSFPGNLPADVESAKLAALTEAIAANLGIVSTVYRAGRYGVGRNSRRTLLSLGYEIDMSVRSGFDYSHKGGPDFSRLPSTPWWQDSERRLLEIPLTTCFTGLLARLGPSLFPHIPRGSPLPGALARARLLNRVSLTPEGMTLAEVMPALKAMRAANARLYCISFHSPSAEPGHTPYVRTQADLTRFRDWLERVVDYLLGPVGARPATPHDVLRAARGGR